MFGRDEEVREKVIKKGERKQQKQEKILFLDKNIKRTFLHAVFNGARGHKSSTFCMRACPECKKVLLLCPRPDPIFRGNFGGHSQNYRCFIGIFYMAAFSELAHNWPIMGQLNVFYFWTL